MWSYLSMVCHIIKGGIQSYLLCAELQEKIGEDWTLDNEQASERTLNCNNTTALLLSATYFLIYSRALSQ